MNSHRIKLAVAGFSALLITLSFTNCSGGPNGAGLSNSASSDPAVNPALEPACTASSEFSEISKARVNPAYPVYQITRVNNLRTILKSSDGGASFAPIQLPGLDPGKCGFNTFGPTELTAQCYDGEQVDGMTNTTYYVSENAVSGWRVVGNGMFTKGNVSSSFNSHKNHFYDPAGFLYVAASVYLGLTPRPMPSGSPPQDVNTYGWRITRIGPTGAPAVIDDFRPAGYNASRATSVAVTPNGTLYAAGIAEKWSTATNGGSSYSTTEPTAIVRRSTDNGATWTTILSLTQPYAWYILGVPL